MDPLFELNIDIENTCGRTLVELFSQTIKLAIQEGRLSNGYKMPSTRSLAKVKSVSRNTIISVYDDLCITGYLETITGKGTFVKSQKQQYKIVNNTQKKNRLTTYWQNAENDNFLPHQPPAKYDFKVGVPNITHFPFDKWRQAVNKANRMHFHKNMHTSPIQGLPALRQNIVNHLSYSRAISSHHQQLCITSGAQQAIDIICRMLIKSGQSKVAIERPGYPMARHLFKMHGARIVYIDVDEQGMCIEQIPTDVELIYTTPSHQFPTGVAMSLERRRQLLQLASTHNISIIEDDYDGEFRLGTTPIDALNSLDTEQNVFYIGTFSKCMIPDIRLGFCVSPLWAIKAFCNAKFHTDWHNASLLQTALSLFIEQGHLIKHIRKMRKCYQERYLAICKQINLHCPDFLTPANVLSGVHLSASLVENIDAFSLVNVLKQQDIAVSSIAHFEKNKRVKNVWYLVMATLQLNKSLSLFP
ncbi:MAG: PLP-dependent aminotransferase family protein [Paraglaciecola sp.]|nr:PLP-dependent aminotransferase family protein [Paraglaciecola sp.]